MDISIIIPVFNEESRIASQVIRCRSLSPRPEVIVSDGGSTDGTPKSAKEAGARVVLSGRRGRGPQMDAGAAVASGGALVFLHADVILPEAAYSILQQALHDPALIGGAFRRRFDSPSHLLALGCRLADLRGRWNRIYLGDQAIFVRREAFERLGGFSEALLFEDLDFSLRMRRMGRTRLIEEPVLASSRRFEREGNGKRLFRNLFLTALYLAGADPNRLARRYYPGYYSGTEPATPEAARIPR